MISSISFCILSQGRSEGTINRAIASIVRQGLPGREILVCGELAAAHDIKVFRSNGWGETGELNRMRNLLCSNATKDFVALMVDNIELCDGWYEAIKEADYLDIIGSQIVTNDRIRAVDWAYQVKLGSMSFPYPLAYDEWTTKAYVSGNFMLLRKRVWERIKFDETLLRGVRDDVDFCLRATLAGFRVGVVPQAQAKYRMANSETTADVTFEKSRNTVIAFKTALAAGKGAFKSGDYGAALVHLTKAAEVVPGDPGTLSLMGWTYYFTGRYEKAVEILGEALAADSSNQYAFRGRGWAFLQSGAYANAVVDLTMALKLVNPVHRDDWLETVRGLAWSHYHSGNFGEAIKQFKALLEKSKSHETGLLQDVCRGLGWCCYRMEKFGEAVAHFNDALSNMDPAHPEVIQDARRGLELAGTKRRAPACEHSVAVVADLSARPRRDALFPWGLTRPRRLASALKRVAIKVLSTCRGSRNSAMRRLKRSE
jgi:tetratricopeptide (TPR) repeat protein